MRLTANKLREFPNGTIITVGSKDYMKLEDTTRKDGIFWAICEGKKAYARFGLTTRKLSKKEIIKVQVCKYVEWNEGDQIILDEVEKRYLSKVIKPFRDRVTAIEKQTWAPGEQIVLFIDHEAEVTELPSFKKGSMYKGMKLGYKYTLTELGL